MDKLLIIHIYLRPIKNRYALLIIWLTITNIVCYCSLLLLYYQWQFPKLRVEWLKTLYEWQHRFHARSARSATDSRRTSPPTHSLGIARRWTSMECVARHMRSPAMCRCSGRERAQMCLQWNLVHSHSLERVHQLAPLAPEC